jgi:hypothetical protein
MLIVVRCEFFISDNLAIQRSGNDILRITQHGKKCQEKPGSRLKQEGEIL